ncbi:MAG: efflux RND transporter permease subunit [Neomegalonema sp.]|nr:efflux RND transporter permease subunit [Neomegalonema sp.]
MTGATESPAPSNNAPSGTGGLAGLSVRRPLLAVVMNLLIVIAGAAALFAVEVRELPNVDRPIVAIRANFSGASPTTVDAQATSLVEAAVARVSGVSAIRASSEEGNFRVIVVFNPGRDIDSAANDIREAVARVERRLPDGVDDLTIVKADDDARPVMQVAVWSDSSPIDKLSREVEDAVVPALTAVDGVAEVRLYGARRRVIAVEVAPDRMAALGVTVGDLSKTLSSASFDAPIGSFGVEHVEILVRADASVTTPAAIEALVIRDKIRVRDVASVFFTPQKPTSLARLDGRLVINLGIVRRAGSNTVRISDGVTAAVEKLKLRFPEMKFAVTDDDAIFIRGAIGEVLTTLVIALSVVVIVIWLFTGRIGATLAPAVAIPIALIGSLAAIHLLGFSVNLVTLLALVLATGLVVDDAIVVTENIQRRRAEGLGPRAAAVIGAREVFFAVIATTAVLVAVFTPISFLPGAAGRLFAEFGVLLAITVMISSFVALTMTPMIAAQISNLGGASGTGGGWLGRRLGGLYAALLRPVLAAPLVAFVVCGLLAAGAGGLYTSLGEELTPKEDRGLVRIRLQGPDGAGLAHTDIQVAAVEAIAGRWVKSGAAKHMYSITGRWDPNRGEVGLRLAPWAERTVSQSEIEAAIRPALSKLPGARARLSGGNSLGLRGSAGAALSFAITGPSHPEIAVVAFKFAKQLEGVEGVRGVRVDYQATQPQISIAVDRVRVADLGAPLQEVADSLRALVDEADAVSLNIGDEIVKVVLRSQKGAVRDPTDLLNFTVRTAGGALVPLAQLVRFAEAGVAAELDRFAQRRAIEISANLTPGLSLREATAEVRKLSAKMLPDGFGLLFRGEAATLEETSHDLAITFAIALLVAFLVLAAQFESLTSATVVMLTAPFGVCAAILALWLTGTSINIYSQIGVLMLIGVMAKNGILMVEFADQLRDRGASVWEAAAQASRVRLRPIAMTLASTIVAGLPLVYGSGAGAEARAAIGWVIVGGLGVGALFTLFLTPAAYVLVAGLSRPRVAAGAALDAELAAASGKKAASV